MYVRFTFDIAKFECVLTFGTTKLYDIFTFIAVLNTGYPYHYPSKNVRISLNLLQLIVMIFLKLLQFKKCIACYNIGSTNICRSRRRKHNWAASSSGFWCTLQSWTSIGTESWCTCPHTYCGTGYKKSYNGHSSTCSYFDILLRQPTHHTHQYLDVDFDMVLKYYRFYKICRSSG